jgi:hypothetical protein
VTKVQERCFACGQRARGRVRSGEKPVNPFIFLFAGVLVVAAIVGIIAISSGRSKRARTEVHQQEQARIQDSIRDAVRARRDTAKAAVRNEAAAVLTDEIDKLDQRFNAVRQQVAKDQPSFEIVRMRQLTVTMSDRPGPGSDSIKLQVREGQRMVRNLISDLSRAPKR